MKKNYIIPNTNSVAFHAGSICGTSAGGMSVGGGTLGGGGEAPGSSIDPM